MPINLVILLIWVEHFNVAPVRYFWPASVDLRIVIHPISMDPVILGSAGMNTRVGSKIVRHGCERNISGSATCTCGAENQRRMSVVQILFLDLVFGHGTRVTAIESVILSTLPSVQLR